MVPIHVTDRKKIMKLKMLAGVAALALIGAGVASAAIPNSSTGVITGCYQTSGGTLRVINKQGGAACYAWETELPWNQTGPAGADGATGATGPQGPAGAVGISGYQVLYQTLPSATIPAGETYRAELRCPAGKQPLGGGGYTSNSGTEESDKDLVAQSAPLLDPYNGNGWEIRIRVNANDRELYHAAIYVICAYVS